MEPISMTGPEKVGLVTTPELGPLVPLQANSPHQWIAIKGMMLRVLVGSAVYGTSQESGASDRDEMGVCVEPPETVIGGKTFDQYQFRTQPEGVRSGPGDLDSVTYSVRKFAHLAALGNPSILTALFVPESAILFASPFGHELLERRDMFLSRRAADRFGGYLHSQRQGLLGLRSGGTRNQGRADIRATYGFDAKFAMHMVRLGFQGVELLKTGQISLPMKGGELDFCRRLRRGEITKEVALKKAEQLEGEIKALKSLSRLPEGPNFHAIDQWLMSVHKRHWGW